MFLLKNSLRHGRSANDLIVSVNDFTCQGSRRRIDLTCVGRAGCNSQDAGDCKSDFGKFHEKTSLKSKN